MNYFALWWYPMVLGLLFMYVWNFEKIEVAYMDIIENKYFRMFWNFPLYLGMEFLFIMIIFFDSCKNTKPKIEANKDTLENVHVIVPVHKADDTIKDNVKHLVDLFEQNIWIAENDGTDHENMVLKEMCDTFRLRYVHYPLANKTNALYRTACLVQQTHPEVQYIILLDDDTVLPKNFFLRHDLLADPTTAGYCCCIGINKTKPFNIFEHWVDFEYRTISFRNRARNYQTLKFLHGIICVYKLKEFLEIFRFNYCQPHGLPFGEDAFAGVTTRMIGYQMKQDNFNTVLTYCPRTLFSFCSNRFQGYGASSLFKQRALRWYLSWPRRIPNEIALFLCYDCGSWVGNILYRIDCLWYLFVLYVSIIWIHSLQKLTFGGMSLFSFSILRMGFMLISLLSCYLRFFIMNKQERENVSWIVLLTFPVFLLLILFLYGASFVVSIFYYIPLFRVNYKKCFAL